MSDIMTKEQTLCV